MTKGGRVARTTGLTSVLIIGTVVFLAFGGTGFAWGPEGHKAIAILAERYMRPETRARVHELLGPESIEDASVWADKIRESTRPETAPWHFINIPLRDSKIDLRRDCPAGQCVLVKTEEFLAVLGDPRASAGARREALKFVIHFVADLHQPLHCEDHHDDGGNRQRVIFENRPDHLHWVWDTGLVQEINPDPRRLAVELGREITGQECASWEAGDVSAWVLESHRLAQTAAYRRIWIFGPAILTRGYDDRAKAVIKLQLEKAAVRLTYLLNQRLKH
jgi:nuclease S1